MLVNSRARISQYTSSLQVRRKPVEGLLPYCLKLLWGLSSWWMIAEGEVAASLLKQLCAFRPDTVLTSFLLISQRHLGIAADTANVAESLFPKKSSSAYSARPADEQRDLSLGSAAGYGLPPAASHSNKPQGILC